MGMAKLEHKRNISEEENGMGFLKELGKAYIGEIKHDMEKYRDDYEQYTEYYSEKSDEWLKDEWSRRGKELRGGRREALINQMVERGLGHRT